MPHGLLGDQGDVGISMPSPMILATASRSVAYANALRASGLDNGLSLPLSCGDVFVITNAFSVLQSLTTVSVSARSVASAARVVRIMFTSPLVSAATREVSSGMTRNSIESRWGSPACQ